MNRLCWSRGFATHSLAAHAAAPAAAALLAALLLATSSAAAAPAPPKSSTATPARLDTLLAYPSTYYSLYAPTQPQLFAAAREVEYVRTQWERYMGERPEPVVIAVFESPDQQRRADLTPLLGHGQAPLIYVGPVGGAPARSASAAGAAARISTPRSLSADLGRVLLLEWTRLRLQKLGESPADAASDSVLIARSKAVHTPGVPGVARHPRLADWIEEGIITQCESPLDQGTRLRAMGQSIDKRIPLTEFFTMSAPTATAASATLFVNQASTLARFIGETEGNRAVGEIAAGLLAGKTVGDCLINAKVLYSKPEALEQQYVEWVRKAPGTKPAGGP